LRYRALWLSAWLLPPGVGLSFLVYGGTLTAEQALGTVLNPWQPLFVLAALTLAATLLCPIGRRVARYLEDPRPSRSEPTWEAVRGFPLRFWGAFLAYLLVAPSVVIHLAQAGGDFQATPTDWFRIHLVALTVSILVGLPVFLALLDLFGRALSGIAIPRPLVSLQSKVFLVGSLMPLLISTILVQYYWSRTGQFDRETIIVWVTLTLIAVIGSLLFARSIGRGLAPHRRILESTSIGRAATPEQLHARSTDELGVIAAGYQRVLRELRIHERILELNNRILQGDLDERELGRSLDAVLELVREAIGDSEVFLILYDRNANELINVARTGADYDPHGHFRVRPEEKSTASWVFRHGRSLGLHDARNDPRVGAHLNPSESTQSMVAVPLRSEGRTIGVLMSVNSDRHRHYSPSDVALLEGLAAEVSLAVQTQLFINERHEAQHALQEREERLSLLLNFAGEAIFGVDLQGFCTFANPACARMLGYSGEHELLGRSIHELIHHSHPDGSDYPKSECRIRLATLRQESTHADDEVHWRKDGSSFPIEYWSHPIYKDGELVGTVVAFIDITERKRREQELKQLSEQNRLLLESSSEGIFGIDRELRCTFANRAGAAMLGYRPESLLGEDMHELLNHSTEERVPVPREESFMYRTVHDDRGISSDSEVLWHSNGNFIPVQVSANPIREQGQVTGAVVVFRNITEARAMARKMDYLATHDPLTGLVNRREFERRLQHAIEGARLDGGEHALCYLDLDQFKVVNDTCGHIAGDELLRQLTVLLKRRMRQSDTLARLGGDEFGVLLEHCRAEQALRLAAELRGAVQEFRFVWDDKTFAVGVSIGLVTIDAHAGGIGAVLSAADSACYMAKEGGRNRVHMYQPNDTELARRQGEMQWVARIHRALDESRLELACQRIVPVAGAGAAGLHLEVLVRMRDEQGRSVPPGAFLPAAERYNLMPTVDRWIVGATLDTLAAHREVLDQIEMCSINLSGNSVGEEDFLRFISERLQASGIPAHKICFEITETAAVANLSRALAFIGALREQGCRFALDDFGSGMSSFAYLKTLPVDFLKIDGNFVRDMPHDPVDHAMVEAINQVGHVMGILTIAEFVENERIFAALGSIGVDFAQGIGIAAPEPLRDLLVDLRDDDAPAAQADAAASGNRSALH
jgi:diguanylate cyclase (GGDEF)-like protein/PAS domain S-box-containing protein